jgi:hypothetical protein
MVTKEAIDAALAAHAQWMTMVAIQHGTVSVSIPDEYAPPAQAGNMGPDEVRRIAKAPRGIGLVCNTTADVLEKSSGKFDPAKVPETFTP